jgi:hypothetical protein
LKNPTPFSPRAAVAGFWSVSINVLHSLGLSVASSPYGYQKANVQKWRDQGIESQDKHKIVCKSEKRGRFNLCQSIGQRQASLITE